MRRGAVLMVVASGALATLAAAASATGTELDAVGSASPSCNGALYCVVLARTTAFQVSNGSVSYPTMVPSDGRITAWHIALGGLHKQFFDEGYGSPSEAAIAVIAPQSTEPQSYKLVALGPVETLEPYFFKTAQFALSTPIPVKKGEIVALTVPTWAPALALGYGNDTSYRASRSTSQCGNDTAQTSQVVVGSSALYSCVYQTAGLTYGATLEPGAPSIQVEKVKVTRHRVLVTIKTTETGMVTITGAGLRSTAVQPLSAGTHQLTVALTKRGQAERKRHQEIKLSIRLNADSRSVSASREIKL